MFSVPENQAEYNVVLELYILAFPELARQEVSPEDMAAALNRADLTQVLAGRFPA